MGLTADAALSWPTGCEMSVLLTGLSADSLSPRPLPAQEPCARHRYVHADVAPGARRAQANDQWQKATGAERKNRCLRIGTNEGYEAGPTLGVIATNGALADIAVDGGACFRRGGL